MDTRAFVYMQRKRLSLAVGRQLEYAYMPGQRITMQLRQRMRSADTGFKRYAGEMR